GKLSEADVDAGLREVRLAMLEADVNYKVVKDFIANIRARAVGAEVMESLNPGQQLVKIVDEELVRLLGDRQPMSYAPSPPTVIVLAGLQGSGKTTTAGKLALFIRREGHRPLLVSTDVRRPAAMEQLEVLAKGINAPAFAPRATDPVKMATRAAVPPFPCVRLRIVRSSSWALVKNLPTWRSSIPTGWPPAFSAWATF